MKKIFHAIKIALLFIFSAIFTICVLVYLVLAITEPEVRPIMLVLLTIFLILDILCIWTFTKSANSRIEKVAFSHKAKTTPPIVKQTIQVNSQKTKSQQNVSFFAKQLENEIRIMNESYELASKTLNLETFRMRYDLYLEKANLILSRTNNPQTIQRCKSLIADQNRLKARIVADLGKKAIEDTKKLKTQQGIIARLESVYNELQKATFLHDTPDYEKMIDFLQKTITQQTQTTDVVASIIKEEHLNSASGQESIATIEQPLRVFFDTYSFKGMIVKSSVYPPRDNFHVFNNNELLFFNALADQFINNKLVPQNVTLTRMGGNDFEVEYENKNGGCYVGRIDLSSEPKFAVKKVDGFKAIKIFTSKDEAEKFIHDKENYFIEERKQPFRMQYLIGMTKVESITTYNVQDCIDTIFRWIRYINYCKRN